MLHSTTMEKYRVTTLSRGFINGGCLLIIITLGLLWGGGQEIYTSIRNQKPLVMTCQEYLDQRPSSEWVTLTDARLDFLNSAVLKSKLGDRTKEVFIPLKGKNDNPERAIQLLLASDSAETISLMDTMSVALEKAKTPADVSPDILEKFREVKTVSGLIRFGINADSRTEEKLAKLGLPLAADYVMLNEGKSPSAVTGLIMFGLGLLLVGYQVRKALAAPNDTAPPPNLPPRNDTPPPLPAR